MKAIASFESLTFCRSAASGELDLHITRIGPPLVGCSGPLASHFE
jgi:hypothetical protein